MEFSQLKNKFCDIDETKDSPEVIVVYLKSTSVSRPKLFEVFANGEIREETAFGSIKLMGNADIETMFLFLTKVREQFFTGIRVQWEAREDFKQTIIKEVNYE